MLLYGSHVSLLSTCSALLAFAATIAVEVADGRADEDAAVKLVTNPLEVGISVAVLLDVIEDPELLPDPPPAPPVYSDGPGIVYAGRGLIQIS